jgi:hypothetical protein
MQRNAKQRIAIECTLRHNSLQYKGSRNRNTIAAFCIIQKSAWVRALEATDSVELVDAECPRLTGCGLNGLGLLQPQEFSCCCWGHAFSWGHAFLSQFFTPPALMACYTQSHFPLFQERLSIYNVGLLDSMGSNNIRTTRPASDAVNTKLFQYKASRQPAYYISSWLKG